MGNTARSATAQRHPLHDLGDDLSSAHAVRLGVGVQGEPSWGIMISDAKIRLWQGHWYELGGATVAMFFIVLAFNLFGDALRDALDPKDR